MLNSVLTVHLLVALDRSVNSSVRKVMVRAQMCQGHLNPSQAHLIVTDFVTLTLLNQSTLAVQSLRKIKKLDRNYALNDEPLFLKYGNNESLTSRQILVTAWMRLSHDSLLSSTDSSHVYKN
jgi:hypothetical protein